MTSAGGAGAERLRRTDRLRDRRDFQRVSREGARVSSRSFIVLAARHREGGSAPRLGITTSRRVGPAVVRSRVRRHVREWFRRSRSHLPAGRDLVVIARPSAAALSHRDVEEELGAAADRLHGAVAARERTR